MKSNLPDMSNVEPHERLRALLDTWLRLYYTDERVKGFTHARAYRSDGSTGVKWALLDADDNAIRREQPIPSLGDTADFAAMTIIDDYTQVGSSRGRLTFRFSPPAVSIDVFNDQNDAVVAMYLVDVDAEQRVQAELLKLINPRS